MTNNEYNMFIKIIIQNAFETNVGKYYSRFGYNLDEIFSYLLSLSKSRIKLLFSNKKWCRHPKYVFFNSNIDFNKGALHTKCIHHLVNEITSNRMDERYKNLYDALIKYSDGIILLYTLYNSTSKDQMTAAKRGMKSSDNRVRTYSARIVPHKYLKNYVNDKNFGVRKIIATRIGIEANPDLFLESPDFSTRITALGSKELSRDEVLLRIDEISKNISSKEKISSKEEDILVVLLNKLRSNDIIFYIDLSSKSENIEKYITKRINTHA
jgi:hypothetical protein